MADGWGDRPWEDESLKGEYYKTKRKRISAPTREPERSRPAVGPIAESFSRAAEEERRKRRVDRMTKPLRKWASGTEE